MRIGAMIDGARRRAVVPALLMAFSLATAASGEEQCVLRYLPAGEESKSSANEWKFSVGSRLSGSDTLDFDGDGRADHLAMSSEIQRDRSVNTVTGDTSKEVHCWFNTRLEIRGRGTALLYSDHWSIKFEDMSPLLESCGARSPQDYFARFARLKSFYENGLTITPRKELEVDPEAIAWSLKAQGIAKTSPKSVLEQLSHVDPVRTFIYRADWREDIRVVAYVPGLARGVMIKAGYD